MMHFEIPWISSTDERFVFYPAAPAFEPGRIHLAGQSEFIQDLYSQWYQNAFAWEGKVPSCVILNMDGRSHVGTTSWISSTPCSAPR